MKNRRMMIGVLAAVLLFRLWLPYGIVADTDNGDFGKHIAGVYVVSLTPEQGTSRILTISADGNLSSIQSVQFSGVAGLAFSNPQGVYKRTGPREITAQVVNIATDPATQEFLGVAIATYLLTFDESLRSVYGQVDGQVFAPGVNPLHPDGAPPLQTFTDTFDLQRITP
jgi:hypothetical protein